MCETEGCSGSSWVYAPGSKEEEVGKEVARCEAVLEKGGALFRGDLYGWVASIWDRTARLRGLFGGGWRWSWVGAVEGSVSAGDVSREWTDSCMAAGVQGVGSVRVFQPQHIKAHHFGLVEVQPSFEVFRRRTMEAGGDVGFMDSGPDYFRVEIPASGELGRDRLKGEFQDLLAYSEVMDGARDAVVFRCEEGGKPSRVFLRALGKLGKRLVGEDGANLQRAGALFCEAMGQRWSSFRHRWRVVFSCAPSSFLRLGEYGETCCFRFGGAYDQSKVVLPQTGGAVVGLVYREPEAGDGKGPVDIVKGKVGGRAWGFMSPFVESPGFGLSNHYLLTRENSQEAFITAARALYGVRGGTVGSGITGHYSEPVNMGSVYVNGDGWCWVGPGTGSRAALCSVLESHRADLGRMNPSLCGGGYAPVLEKEDGGECAVCGWQGDLDSFNECGACGHLVCSECYHWDEIADIAVCHDCGTVEECVVCGRWGQAGESVNECDGCGDWVCGSCEDECYDCGDRLCHECRVEDEGGRVCASCQEAREEEREALAEAEGEAAREAEGLNI